MNLGPEWQASEVFIEEWDHVLIACNPNTSPQNEDNTFLGSGHAFDQWWIRYRLVDVEEWRLCVDDVVMLV